MTWWLFAAVTYYGTLRMAERRAVRRPRPPLDDVGFDYAPSIPALTDICDAVGVLGVAWMLCVAALGTAAQRELIRAMCDYHALGNLFSASLHTGTILPTSDFKASAVPLMGGSADKLMSNHTFNFGMFVHCATLVHPGLLPAAHAWWALPALVGAFSWCMLCTRCHYTVDIVLAWWAIAVLIKVNPQLVVPLL